ncbi:MAG: hypothetical protein M3Y74_04490 [Chloroflexota bacterium]|nr:hypothetical protein [Chloroflexota bacterium]
MDWTAFAERMGSLRSDGSEHCNSLLAYAALEQLVGDDAIDTAVDQIVDNAPGRLLATYALVRLVSLRASERAYRIYQEATDNRAYWAVWLVVEIHHPRAFAWVSQILTDPEIAIAVLGMDLLDALLSSPEVVEVESLDVESILAQAERDPRQELSKRVKSSRILLQPEPDSQRDVTYLAEYLKARDDG